MMSDQHFTIRRRDLFAIGPACALIAGLAPSQAAAAALDHWLGQAPDGFSLAYWPGSADLPRFERLREMPARDDDQGPEDDSVEPALAFDELIPAERLASGDPRFARGGVRFQVHGLFGADAGAVKDLADLAIEVLHAPFHGVAVKAWGFAKGTPGSVSAPTAMKVPITAQGGLGLSIAIDGAAAAPTATSLTLGDQPGRLKLRRGIYLALWRGATGRPLPSWRQLQLQSKAPSDPPPDQDGEDQSLDSLRQVRLVRRLGAEPLDHPYLVMSFDYAS